MPRCIVCHQETYAYLSQYSSEDAKYDAGYPKSICQPIMIPTCKDHKKDLKDSQIADYIVLCYEWNEKLFHKRERVEQRISDYKYMVRGLTPPSVYGWVNKPRSGRKR